MSLVYIGLGANLGDPTAHCREALRRITSWPETHSYRASSLYRTEPKLRAGGEAQAWYVNAVLEIETPLSPQALLTRLLAVEAEMGRDLAQKGQWLPRPIDLDLLAYDDCAERTETLILPHPHLHERRFVLVPWAELAPAWVHPQFGKSIQDLLAVVQDDKKVIRLCSFY